MKTCLLCLIPKDEVTRIILEDEFSFICINKEPILDSHLMVLPKRHVESMDKLTPNESKSLLKLLDRISNSLKDIFKTKGCLTVMNHNGLKSQDHIHFHIIATDEGLRHILSTHFKKPFRKELNIKDLENIGNNIKKHL